MKFVRLNDHPEHFNMVSKLLYEQWKDVYYRLNNCKSYKEMRQFYKNLYNSGNAQTYLLMKYDNTFVGCYTLVLIAGKPYICDVYVAKEYRRRNIGKLLIDNAVKRAPIFAPNSKWIYLDAYADTVIFYLKLGFESEGRSVDGRYMLRRTISNDIIPMSDIAQYIAGVGAFALLLFIVWYLIR